jgi:hypothetical protein
MDLRANFTSSFVSPFHMNSGKSQLDSGLNHPNSTTSTISSRGSAGSGYHSDGGSGFDDDAPLKPYLTSSVGEKSLTKSRNYTQFHCELENRLLPSTDEPLKVSDLSRKLSKRSNKPPPPPRTTGVKPLKNSSSTSIPLRLSRMGSGSCLGGSILMHRPILAKTNYSNV